ncbi:proton-coupled amino acid transporter-like protein CG1139 isoform X1 [Danaus plexippus]|uniref:proton-coupled amino acid transporter-like protein CG1139 isoform X1 n=1 Tax=Danaus plexippus TaxID=13037 RepID=UPI000239D4E2|nr:proton-coupled amino acid transporter-like protein CG1139 isoform X1 [Danaus plexippus]
MPSTEEDNRRKTPTNESEDDLRSLCNLELELTEYFDRSDSRTYHELYPGAEMINYDFTAERQNIYSTNLIESIAHLIKGCLGAGLLGMHEAFKYGGLWTSLAVTLIIGYIITYCMIMLVSSAQIMYGRLRVPRLSYPDLAEVAVATGPFNLSRRASKIFRYSVNVFLFLHFNGTCCIFEIMIAQTLKKVLESVSSSEFSISQYILMITLPLVSLCMIRSLKYLAPFSLVADLFIGICVIATVYYSITAASSLSDLPAWNDVQGFFRLMGICIFSINGIGVTLPVENNMRKPKYFKTVLLWAMPIVILFNAAIGFFGYWAWGKECKSPFTIHMPSNTASNLMQSFLAITLAVTFAVHFWIPFRIIWRNLSRRHKSKKGIWERMYRCVHVLVLSGLCVALPDMMTWMTFIGNVFTAFLLFIFPAFIEIMVMWREPRRRKFRLLFMKNICIISLGTVLCGGAFYYA